MRECETGDNEHGAGVRWVTNVAVGSGRHQPVARENAEVKGEELAEFSETLDTDEHPNDGNKYTRQKHGCDNVGSRGWTYGCIHVSG